MIHALLFIALSAAQEAAPKELLLNPSAEFLYQGMPEHWSVYVEPMKGAEGVPDTEVACDGAYSLRLHNPMRYAVEPANNWSQNILQSLGGYTLEVRGSIKTEGADEATLWIQCYRKNPWKVLLQTSTGNTQPVRGTADWTPVEMTVQVPQGTDFVVLRCVLKGVGTAWFDALSIKAEPPKAPPAQAPNATKPIVKLTPPTTPDVKMSEIAIPGIKLPDIKKPEAQAPEVETPETTKTETPEVPETPAITPAEQQQVSDEELKRQLYDSQEELRKLNEDLRKSNAALLNQVKSMQQELDKLKSDVKTFNESAERLKSGDVPDKESPVTPPSPPLVPHTPTEPETR